ncbi:hypothetical protein JZ751_018896 [Albula glossodonta]|uniref:hyaluronoglucosaminidase n=1 Tax=Albula glossodonta TaxID=121402 RepID=A0A8T2MV01_9TELE|nr:hypothetical protein JZ751_018896 [Albula glossodonta]
MQISCLTSSISRRWSRGWRSSASKKNIIRQQTGTMQVNDGPHRAPIFMPPSNGTSHRSPGYVPGRIAPVRSPPPPKIPPPPPLKPAAPPERQATFTLSEEEQKRERASSLRKRRNTLVCFAVSLASFFLVLVLVLTLMSADVLDENCPDHNPSLSRWNPGLNPKRAVVVRMGDHFRLDSSATLHSVTIQKGGLLVFADDKDGSKNITLRTRHLMIEDGGALHIGAPKCRYRSRATITLLGRSDEQGVPEVPDLGRKFIAVQGGGTLELHGAPKLSWTLLSRTIPASGLATGGYAFLRNFSRGINLRVVDQDTGGVLFTDRFDTHDSHNDSRRLHELLKSLPTGRIVAMAVGDSAAKSLLEETKRTIQNLLGSIFINDLKYRQAWALVSVIRGGNGSCSEDVREHENHDTGGQALARRNFLTADGVRFSVTAYSEWRNGFPISGFQVDAVDQVVLNLQDDVSSWKAGDRIVVASTDYSMYQAEEFTLLPCPECTRKQVRIQGKPQFAHVGEILDGVDMRAEIFKNFSSVHLSHVELRNMGQQVRGRYPVNFHLCGDVDERGGYSSPAYLDSLSIHHSFSRCVTIRDTVGYDTLGHCFFLEDGIEQRNTFFHNLGLDAGIWYVFHVASTGDSHGLVPETKAELTPLGIFYNNRVHSNFKAGLFIDKGVKTTNASAADPREYLCLDNNARFRPHEDADPSKPRVCGQRGGIIVCEQKSWLKWRPEQVLGRGRSGRQDEDPTPEQIYDGPIRLTKSTFRNYVPTSDRFTSAVGFNLKNTWQLTPRNNLSAISFQPSVTLKTFFGKPGQWFEENELDGDKNSIFHDADGSVTGYPDTYVGRLDNFLIRHPKCVNFSEWNGVACSGRYSQGAPSQQYQPILMIGKSYTLHWNGKAPRETVLSLINFNKGDWVQVGLCYPSDTAFQVMSDTNDRQSNTFDNLEDYGPVSSLAELERRRAERKYYFDKNTGLLWLYLQARFGRDGQSYCSEKGCERVKITAMTPNKQVCNCMSRAYPKYTKTPKAIVPMPVRATTPCKNCGASKLVVSSDPWNTYLQVQIKSLSQEEVQKGNNESFITVNDEKIHFHERGFFLVAVDACTGKVTKRTPFASVDQKMEQFLRTGIPRR